MAGKSSLRISRACSGAVYKYNKSKVVKKKNNKKTNKQTNQNTRKNKTDKTQKKISWEKELTKLGNILCKGMGKLALGQGVFAGIACNIHVAHVLTLVVTRLRTSTQAAG